MRILLCNGAYLGDLILATAVLPVLKAAYPEAKIGFLIGSWAKPVVENHAAVDWVHFFDHPGLNRASIPSDEKKRQGNLTWHKAIEEIENNQYDLAIDLYYFYKTNAGLLLQKAQVPERVGFWASPAHYTFTKRLFWDHTHLHMVENHGMMLQELGIDEKFLGLLKPTLHYKDTVSHHPIPFSEYLLVHVGSGDPRRAWNIEGWQRLTTLLGTLGYPIVFLGHGEKEKRIVDALMPLVPCALDLSNALSWRQLLPIIQKSRLLVGLESMAGHLAAYLETPAVLIYGSALSLTRWRPYASCCRVVTSSTDPLSLRKINQTKAIHTIASEEVFKSIMEIF